jgi:hypothetical protein
MGYAARQRQLIRRFTTAALAGLPALESGQRPTSTNAPAWALAGWVPGAARRRLEIIVPDEALDRLAAVARRLGVSVEDVMCEAVLLGQHVVREEG